MQGERAHVVLRREQRSLRRGRRQRGWSGGISACSVNHTRSVLAPSRAHTANLATPLHTTTGHNNTSTENSPGLDTLRSPLGVLLPSRRRHISPRGPSLVPFATLQRRRRGAVLPSGRAPSPPLLFAATRPPRIGRLQPPSPSAAATSSPAKTRPIMSIAKRRYFIKPTTKAIRKTSDCQR